MSSDLAVTLQEIEELCNVGTAGETKQRQGKALSGSGAKAQRARHARETLDILARGRYLPEEYSEEVDITKSICEAVGSSTYFSEEGWRRPPPRVEKQRLSIEVRCCRVLDAAQDLATSTPNGAPPGVLNFASARNPGGGFTTGAEAQEESLARSSGIYPCLSIHFDSFFAPNRRAASGLYTHGLIHSPRVPVIRDSFGALLSEPYFVDFVTAAAPNCGVLRNRFSAQDAALQCSDALRERMRRVLHTFASNGCIDLVLGAWGCGVFGNDPGTVAQLFNEALTESQCFRRVVFAVLDPKMAEVFGEEFHVSVEGVHDATAKDLDTTVAQKAVTSDSKASRKQKRWQKGRVDEDS